MSAVMSADFVSCGWRYHWVHRTFHPKAGILNAEHLTSERDRVKGESTNTLLMALWLSPPTKNLKSHKNNLK